jgi:two-component system, chemotaxis family, chemotaxis protein CheY
MARRRPKVLILDGDKESCLGLHRALFEGNTSFDVLLATTAETAREIMRDVVVDVLVTDVDLPGSGGVDLVCWAAVEFPEVLFVVRTSHEVEELQQQMAGLGCLRLMKKPCAPKEVLKIVRESLDCIHRLSGCFSTLSAADLIQMLCLAQRTAALRITANGMAGSVMVKSGQLVHATWGSLVGHKALCEILDAQDGVFRTTPLPDGIEPSIHTNWQHALMEAVRELDERSSSSPRKSGSFPAIRLDDSLLDKMSPSGQDDEVREPPKTSLPSGADARKSARSGGVASSLVDKGFAALRAGNVEEARQCWLAAKQLDPENRALDLNLKRLDSRAPR